MTSNAAHEVNLVVDDDEQDEATRLFGHGRSDKLRPDSDLSSYADSLVEESSPLSSVPNEPDLEETIPVTSLPKSVSRGLAKKAPAPSTPFEARTIVRPKQPVSSSMATVANLRPPTASQHRRPEHQRPEEQELVEPTSVLTAEGVRSWLGADPGQPLPGHMRPHAQHAQARQPVPPLPPQGHDATSILSGQEVQQWLASQGQAPLPALGSAAPVTPTMPASHAGQADDELFAMPHVAAKKTTHAPQNRLVGNILLALVAIVAIFVALAIALPGQRAAIQERIFPTAKPPLVVSSTVMPALTAIAPSEEALHLNVEKLMSSAATAVVAGRRADALKIYKQLAAAYPDVAIYRNLVRALTVSEVNQ